MSRSEAKEYRIPDDDDALLTAAELAEFLRVRPSWVYDHVRTRKAKQLPHLKVGRYLRFQKATVLEYLGKNGA